MTLGIVGPVVGVAQAVAVGVQAVVDIALPHHLSELLGIQHFHLVGIGLYGNAGVEVNSHLSLLASLGGDDDHTIGST